jgi:xylulokinase
LSTATELLIGLDVGTQGVRAIVADSNGTIVAQASQSLPMNIAEPPLFEQDPREWWHAATVCLKEVVQTLGPRADALHAIAVTSTSGTLCLLDDAGMPVRPAIMYSDRRAVEEAEYLNRVVGSIALRHGYQFNSSFLLPKLLWVRTHEPMLFEQTRFIAHAGDVITGRLTGIYDTTDWSQALKSGYDLIEGEWPPSFFDTLDLPHDKFPRVIAPGELIGEVTRYAAAETGLPVGLKVVAGMTDGCTAQIAGGAIEAGQWLSVLGTTLVIKGVTPHLLRDPMGRIYSHRHPSGMWLPGGASNTGGEVLTRRFADADLAELDRMVASVVPTGLLCYPLERVGERFPFMHPKARTFFVGKPETTEQYYAACLEGVGYVERLAYDVLQGLGAPVEGEIRVAGGGAKSRPWLQIRANILNRSLIVPKQTDVAFGAAVLAASFMVYPHLIQATQSMVHIEDRIDPDGTTDMYTAYYHQFVAACQERGYVVSTFRSF